MSIQVYTIFHDLERKAVATRWGSSRLATIMFGFGRKLTQGLVLCLLRRQSGCSVVMAGQKGTSEREEGLMKIRRSEFKSK